jgi:GTP pyrophosphokinase
MPERKTPGANPAPHTVAGRAGMARADIQAVHEAAILMQAAHAGQFRAHGTPYADHPAEVMRILLEEAGLRDSEVLLAALLHDVIEDSDLALGVIEARFGARVAGIVSVLTKDHSLPRDARDAETVRRIRDADPGARAVKLSDRLHNLRDCVRHTEAGFASRYLDSTIRHYLPLAIEAGEPWAGLYEAAIQAVREALRECGGLPPL